MHPSPPSSYASLPFSLRLSHSPRVSLQAVSEFWRSTKGWEPFMVRIPNPDTTLRLPHTCTTEPHACTYGVCARTCANVCVSERACRPACIRARTRVLLNAYGFVYTSNASQAMSWTSIPPHLCARVRRSCGCTRRKLH